MPDLFENNYVRDSGGAWRGWEDLVGHDDPNPDDPGYDDLRAIIALIVADDHAAAVVALNAYGFDLESGTKLRAFCEFGAPRQRYHWTAETELGPVFVRIQMQPSASWLGVVK